MKNSTLLLIGVFTIFSTVLLAKPIQSTYSVVTDTQYVIRNIAPEARLSPIPDSGSVFQKRSLIPLFFVFNDICGMGTGNIQITPDPNTPGPWTYNWSTGATVQDLTGLMAGTYFLAITDANGNVQSMQFQVLDGGPPAMPVMVGGMIGNSVCGGPFNGSITLAPGPLVPPLTWTDYEWSTGATTQNISGLQAGAYSVTISYGNTCTLEQVYEVPDLANSPAFALQVGDEHCELSDGGIRVLPGVQGVGPFTYLWSNGSPNSFLRFIPAGTYTVTVTGANGCTTTDSGVVGSSNWDIDVLEFNLLPNTLCNGATGSIDLIRIERDIVGGFTYQWSNGATTQDLTNVPNGIYFVTITLSPVCTTQRIYSIPLEPALPVLLFNPVSAKCGLSNGNITLTPQSGGTPPYTYLWSNGATTQNLMNVPAGSYDVSVIGTNACPALGNVIIPDEDLPVSYVGTVIDQFSCDTTPNGKITLVLMPASLSYQWSNGASTTILTNLTPGDYTVTISAGGTCTAVETFNVGTVVEFPIIPIVPTPSTCGLANGSADLTVNGNAATPFTYLWSNGATTQDLNKVKADTFFVTVTSSVGCSTLNQVIIPNKDSTIQIIGNVLDNISCNTPVGAIELSITPVDTAYVYIWSSGQTTDSLYNLTAGDYLVTVTLGLTCIAYDTFPVINQALPPDLASASNSANCGLNNGSADLNVSGGTGPFNYLWSNAATTEDLAGLIPGTYSVTVTGANGCTAVNVANVLNNNTPLNVNGIPLENTSCSVANGSIDLGVNPAGTYNYLWSNSATTEDLANLGVGTYTVTVTLGTCLSSSSFSVANNALLPNLASAGTSANCGLNNGSADLNVTGGTGPFSYLWSNAATTEDLAGLIPGTYSVTVTGSNGCSGVSTANVLNNNIALSLNASPLGNSSCTLANGSIDMSVNPAGIYTYLWSNAGTNEDLSSLNAGSYTITVSLGTCQSSSTFVVVDNTVTPAVTSNITAAVCSLNNGAIDLSVSGPAGAFTYLWSNADTGQDLNNVLPGNYTVTVTAANGCTTVSTLNVANNASNFSLAATPAPLTNCTTNNGAIDLNVTPAGAFTYLWSNTATTEDLNGLPPGTYTVSVTQSGSCTATASYFVLDQTTNPLSAQNIVPELCGQANGSIDLNVSGGTGPFTYFWASGQSSQDLTNIIAGAYAVTVTDANSCTVIANAIVPGNTISFALSGTPSANSSCLQNNGAIDLAVNPPGGVTYLWSNQALSEDLSGLGAGTYTVTVSAGGNCTNTAVFTVASNVPSPQLSQNITAALCGQPSGGIDLSVSGSPAPYQYNWSNAVLVQDLINVVSGSYTVTVTAANGCTSTQNFVVPENVLVPSIGSVLTQSTSCSVNNGAIDLSITPAVAQGYTFLWSNTAITEDLANLAGGSYTVTVSGGGGCTNTSAFNVGSNLPLPAISENIAAAACGQASGSIGLSISGSPAPYSYLWSTGATVEDLSQLLSGNYAVTVTAANGCTTVDNYTVQENVIAPVVNGLSSPANSCFAFNGAIDLTVSFATAYTLLWSNGSVAEDLSNLAAGSYTVTVNGGGACTQTASFSIVDQTTQPQTSISASTTALDCNTATSSLSGTVTGTTNPTTLQWLNNGSVLGNNNTLLVNAPGLYSFVVIDNVTACADTSSISISQSLNPPALSVASPGLLTCSTSAQTLTGSSPVSGVQLSWASIVGTDTTFLGNGSTLSVSAPGTYFLLGSNPANNCANGVAVTVNADQAPPTANAGVPFTLDCAGETAALNGSGSGGPNLAYQWTSQDGHFVSGANTASPLIDEPGTYQLLLTNPANGCTDTDLVTIEPEVPVAFAWVQQPSCLDPLGKLRIDSVAGLSAPILYSLNQGTPTAQNQFLNLSPGTYTVDALGGNGCSASTVVVLDAPQQLEIGLLPTATINLGYSYLIETTLNIPDADIASIQWTPSSGLACDTCLNTLATPFSTTQYRLLVVSNAGCEARGNLLLTVDETRKVYGPNIFSPDDDGTNDRFTIFADPLTVVKIKSLQVYSRWGEAVYERRDFAPGDTNIGWDGTFKGQKLNPAVFVWQAVVEFVDGREVFFKGDVMLQR